MEQLEPPAELASWHAAVLASQRRYVAAMRQFQQAGTGRDASAVAEAAERVEHARKAVDAAMSAVSGR